MFVTGLPDPHRPRAQALVRLAAATPNCSPSPPPRWCRSPAPWRQDRGLGDDAGNGGRSLHHRDLPDPPRRRCG